MTDMTAMKAMTAKAVMRSVLRAFAWIGGSALLLAAALLFVALRALAPKDGEWRITLQAGPWQREASVPVLLRWASHPLVLPHLAGRTLTTRAGLWLLDARADGSLEATCAPCQLRLASLGPQPVAIPKARLTLMPRGADRYDGRLWLGATAEPVVLPWRAELKADALHVHGDLAPTPLAQLVALFGAAIPEAAQARIDGRFAAKLDATLDGSGLHVQRLVPQLDGIAVAGLGTEALIDAEPGARCRPQPAGGRIEGWLPHAVIAAEDQAFMQHPGYDLEGWLAVWKHNAQDGAELQGASTITQQLAKLLYTGDERSALRKLREWLYAVEMERTLGKGRILQLYLSVLPWGDGICGAEAAARHHLGKPANKVTPREAAWLASLLINPDAQLRRWTDDEPAARERTRGVLAGMRKLPRARRESEQEALADWRPPVARPLLRSAGRATSGGTSAPTTITSAAP